MSAMRATRDLLRRVEAMAGFYRHSDGFFRLGREARAEVEAMERVVEAARGLPLHALGRCAWDVIAALAELDGQTEPEAERAEGTLRGSGRGRRDAFDPPTTEGGRSGSVCPCRVHGDPDGRDCGETCA